MKCPICNSEVEVPTVDVGVGEIQCGPAVCHICFACQNADGTWTPCITPRSVSKTPEDMTDAR